jgi:hypothetical protein
MPMNTQTNAYALIPVALGTLIFNQQELCAFAEDWISVLKDNKIDLPNFNLVSYKSPLVDNGWVVSNLISDRDLEFEIYIKGNDRVDYEDKVQAFKKKIIRQEWTLQLVIGSQSLICTATQNWFKQTENDSELAGTFNLKFKSLTNYTDWFQTQLSYLNILGWFQGWITNEGHREADLSITMSFTNAVALNTVTVLVNDYPITISETINPWDILYIDSVEGRVQLNAIDVNYDWLLPFLKTNPDISWFNPIEFQFNWGSTVDANITMFYNRQFT